VLLILVDSFHFYHTNSSSDSRRDSFKMFLDWKWIWGVRKGKKSEK